MFLFIYVHNQCCFNNTLCSIYTTQIKAWENSLVVTLKELIFNYLFLPFLPKLGTLKEEKSQLISIFDIISFRFFCTADKFSQFYSFLLITSQQCLENFIRRVGRERETLNLLLCWWRHEQGEREKVWGERRVANSLRML